MENNRSVLRDTDAEAIQLARSLIAEAPFAALAVIDPETGFPNASRILTVADEDGVPIILVSQLSAHTRALEADPRAGLLFSSAGKRDGQGDSKSDGKGDPMTHPRLSVQCLCQEIPEPRADNRQRLHRIFLSRHPKAKLYIDLPDFRFLRLMPQSASLNAGFGRAYRISAYDLLIRPGSTSLPAHETGDSAI